MTTTEPPPVSTSFFTRAEALARGETDRTLQAALRAGLILRLRHGAYARRAEVDALDREARHLLQARAALRQQRGEVALAGPSSALFHGYAVYGHDLSRVHLIRLDAGTARREAGVVHHVGGLGAAKRAKEIDGVRVVSPADAVWQTALLSSLEGAVVTADCALRLRDDLMDPLRDLVRRTKAQPRSRTARLALRLARAESESPGESLTRVACYRHGIPAPTLQQSIVDGQGRPIGRSDFYWEAARLIGEFDGKIKYGKLLREGQSPTDAVVDEKEREDAMRATGRGMTRFVWRDVQPGTAALRMARLAREIEESRRLYVSLAS